MSPPGYMVGYAPVDDSNPARLKRLLPDSDNGVLSSTSDMLPIFKSIAGNRSSMVLSIVLVLFGELGVAGQELARVSCLLLKLVHQSHAVSQLLNHWKCVSVSRSSWFTELMALSVSANGASNTPKDAASITTFATFLAKASEPNAFVTSGTPSMIRETASPKSRRAAGNT